MADLLARMVDEVTLDPVVRHLNSVDAAAAEKQFAVAHGLAAVAAADIVQAAAVEEAVAVAFAAVATLVVVIVAVVETRSFDAVETLRLAHNRLVVEPVKNLPLEHPQVVEPLDSEPVVAWTKRPTVDLKLDTGEQAVYPEMMLPGSFVDAACAASDQAKSHVDSCESPVEAAVVSWRRTAVLTAQRRQLNSMQVKKMDYPQTMSLVLGAEKQMQVA
jgi:hypothetical protein